jgi:hypothetical protein
MPLCVLSGRRAADQALEDGLVRARSAPLPAANGL